MVIFKMLFKNVNAYNANFVIKCNVYVNVYHIILSLKQICTSFMILHENCNKNSPSNIRI